MKLNSELKQNCAGFSIGLNRYISPQDLENLTLPSDTEKADIVIFRSPENLREIIHAARFNPKKPKQITHKLAEGGDIVVDIYNNPLTPGQITSFGIIEFRRKINSLELLF